MKATRGTKLRRTAEAKLNDRPPAKLPRSSTALRHELQVHQVELELQNDELRRSRAALEESRDQYLELYDFAPVGYFSLDSHGRLARINLAGAALFGVDRSRVHAKPFTTFIVQRHQPRWVKHLASLEAGPPQTCELLLQPFGRSAFMAQVTSVIADEPTSRAGLRCTVLDVNTRFRADEERERRFTEMVDLNRLLKQTQAQLLQAERLASIGQLSAGVAHGLRQPLAYVTGRFLVMHEQARQLEPSPHQHALLAAAAEAREGLTRLASVVDGLTSFAHLDANLRWQDADLHELIAKSLAVAGSELGPHIQLVRSSWWQPLLLRCRPLQIEQALTAIVVNAAQAIVHSGVVTVRTGREGLDVWVAIDDTGVGIATEHLHRLFEPFFTTKPVGVGTGLGLATAQRIVREHGGRIEVASTLGAGSSFRVVLPVEPPAP
jgi:signal transduction histidine kinase